MNDVYRQRLIRWLRFAVVGSGGFVVDALVFTLLLQLNVPLLMARCVAFFCAASITWYGNRVFTFRSAKAGQTNNDLGDSVKQWLRWIGVSSLSLLPNLLVFQTIVYLWQGSFWSMPMAFVMGIIAGMLCNYQLGSRWVFKSTLLRSTQRS